MTPQRKHVVKRCLILCGGILLAVILFVAFTICETTTVRLRTSAVRQLTEEMVRQRLLISDATNRFGPAKFLSTAEALKYGTQFAVSEEAVSAKVSLYPKTVFFTPNADMTLFLFLDESNRISSYEIGAQ